MLERPTKERTLTCRHAVHDLTRPRGRPTPSVVSPIGFLRAPELGTATRTADYSVRLEETVFMI